MKSISIIKTSKSEKITAIVFFILFIIIAFLCIYPMFWALNNSLKSFNTYSKDSFSLTTEWAFVNYLEYLANFLTTA